MCSLSRLHSWMRGIISGRVCGDLTSLDYNDECNLSSDLDVISLKKYLCSVLFCFVFSLKVFEFQRWHLTVSHMLSRSLFYRTTHLMNLGVKLVFILDGEPPALKKDAMEQRQANRGSFSQGRQSFNISRSVMKVSNQLIFSHHLTIFLWLYFIFIYLMFH